MSDTARDFYETWPEAMAAMKQAAPDIGRGFGGMFQRLMQEGALSVREKELIALAVGMALRCEPCMYSHVQKALGAGATPEQIIEMAGVVVMMQGGPGYVYVPKLLAALETLGQVPA